MGWKQGTLIDWNIPCRAGWVKWEKRRVRHLIRDVVMPPFQGLVCTEMATWGLRPPRRRAAPQAVAWRAVGPETKWGEFHMLGSYLGESQLCL